MSLCFLRYWHLPAKNVGHHMILTTSSSRVVRYSAYQCTKYETASISRYRNTSRSENFKNGARDSDHVPFRHDLLSSGMGYYDPSILNTKSEVSIFTHYEHKNSDATYRKCGCLVTQDHWNVTIRYSAYDFLFTFNRNYVSIMYHLQDAVSFFVESRRFHLPHLHLPPSLGVTPFEFQDNLWNQKTRVPGLSCGAVYIIQCSAVLIQYQNMTDIQTDRMTAYTTQSELTL